MMKRVMNKTWLAMIGALAMTSTVLAGDPQGGEVAKVSALIFTTPDIVLPAILHNDAHRYTSKYANNVWARFERDHDVRASKSPFAREFYRLCVATQHVRLLEDNLDNVMDKFDEAISNVLFGREEKSRVGVSRGERIKSSNKDFFGRPRFHTITPMSRGSSGGKSEGSTKDRALIGIRIDIPFGS